MYPNRKNRKRTTQSGHPAQATKRPRGCLGLNENVLTGGKRKLLKGKLKEGGGLTKGSLVFSQRSGQNSPKVPQGLTNRSGEKRVGKTHSCTCEAN